MDGAAGRSRRNGRGDQGGAAAGHQIHRPHARDREGFEGTAQGEAAFGLRRQATRQARQADEDRCERAEGTARHVEQQDRKSVVEGKSVSVRVDLGGRRIIKKKTQTRKKQSETSHPSLKSTR